MSILSAIVPLPVGGLLLRVAVMTAALIPYLYYGVKDGIYHFTGRKVSLVEHILHALVAITLTAAIACAYRGYAVRFVIGIGCFLFVGAADEYIYHRGLPETESNLHAKEHLALFIFVMVSLTIIWLEDHHWQISW